MRIAIILLEKIAQTEAKTSHNMARNRPASGLFGLLCGFFGLTQALAALSLMRMSLSPRVIPSYEF
jgi:hypothetical protein